VVIRALAIIGLTAACWAVWQYSPVLLEFFGLDDLDIPGRVCCEFLFLTLVELAITRLRSIV